MFSVLASSAAADHRPTAPQVPSSVTPATGWTQSAAQGGVSMDSPQPGGPDNTGVGLQSPLIYFKDVAHTPSPSPFPWRDSLPLLALLTLSLCPHDAGWEEWCVYLNILPAFLKFIWLRWVLVAACWI